MAKNERSPGTAKINELVAVRIPDVRTLAAFNKKRCAAYGAEGAHGRIHSTGKIFFCFLKKSFGTVAFHCVDIIRKDISLDAIPSGGSKAAHTVERLRAEARRAQRKEKNVEGLLAETGRAQRKGKDGGRVCSQRRGERREKERTVEGFARRDAESAKKREERGRVCSQGRGREEKVISKQNRMHENEISGILVDIFVKVHSSHGPGLFESVYEELVCYELTKRGLKFKRQQAVPVTYEGMKPQSRRRADIIVEDKITGEIKSIEALAPVHHKQLLTYLS